MPFFDNEPELNVIKNVPVFKNMSAEELELIFNHLDLKQYSMGQKILREGEKGGNFYIVKKGKARVSVRLPGDTIKVLGTIQSGGSFGEIAALSGELISADVISAETTQCFVLTRAKLEAFRVFYPNVYIKMEESIAEMAVQKIKSSLEIFHQLSKKALPFSVKSTYAFAPNSRKKSHPISISDVNFDVLQESDNFVHFTKDELKKAFSFGKFLSLEKGHILKSVENYVSIVFSGAIQVYDDLIPKMYIVQPGEFFAQPAFFDPSIQFSVAAREVTMLFLLSREDLNSLKDSNFDVWLKLQHTHFKSIVNLLYILDRRLLCFEAQCYTKTVGE